MAGSKRRSFPVYGTDGVEDAPTGGGFQVVSAFSDVATEPPPYQNPQTEESVLGEPVGGQAPAGAEVPSGKPGIRRVLRRG